MENIIQNSNLFFNSGGKYPVTMYGMQDDVYSIWRAMCSRCSNLRMQELHPTYIGCTVDERWYDYQNFAEWYHKNYDKDYQLDKDILFPGNRIYGPDTCVLIPADINKLFTKRDSKRGKYPIGVFFCEIRKKYSACVNRGKDLPRIRKGGFKTCNEAFLFYKKEKEKYIKEVAEKYKNIISIDVYNAMYKYEVNITD